MDSKPFPHDAYDINKSFKDYRENHLNALNELLSIEEYSDKEHEYKIAIEIAYYLFYICNPNDLELVLEEITKVKLLLPVDRLFIQSKIDNLNKGKKYNSKQLTRIKAMVYSDFIHHFVISQNYYMLFPEGIGQFDFVISNAIVISTRKTLEKKVVFAINSIRDKVKKPLDYVRVGALFAEGRIKKKGFDFFFDGKKFKSANQLAKHLKDEVPNLPKSVRQVVGDTLNEVGKHNIYTLQRMKNTIKYCNQHNITIVNSFQSKYNDLENLH